MLAPERSLEFPIGEYQNRVGMARKLMASARTDCLFLTSNRNIRYFTGFYTRGLSHFLRT